MAAEESALLYLGMFGMYSIYMIPFEVCLSNGRRGFRRETRMSLGAVSETSSGHPKVMRNCLSCVAFLFHSIFDSISAFLRGPRFSSVLPICCFPRCLRRLSCRIPAGFALDGSFVRFLQVLLVSCQLPRVCFALLPVQVRSGALSDEWTF